MSSENRPAEEFEQLRGRFQRGEITTEEYERRLEALIRRSPGVDLTRRAGERQAPFMVAPTPAGRPGRRARARVPRHVPVLGGCLMAFAALAALAAAGAGAVGAVFSNGESRTVTTTETVAVTGAPSIELRNDVGDVVIVPGKDGEVSVQATREAHGFSRGRAERNLQRSAVSVSQTADKVTIDARQDHGFMLFWGGTVDLLVSVPPSSTVDVQLDTGALELRGVSGPVTARVDVGDVRLSGVNFAGASSVDVDAGDVTIDGALAAGARLDVGVDVGDVQLTLPAETSARLQAEADVGKISAPGWPLSLVDGDEEGPSASVAGDLRPNPSGAITLRTGVGDIELATR